jgi:hypothetical protein
MLMHLRSVLSFVSAKMFLEKVKNAQRAPLPAIFMTQISMSQSVPVGHFDL